MEKEEFVVLGNGVRVVLSQANSYASHIGLLINAGSRDDIPGCEGAMHLIEHLIFKGTKNRSYTDLMNYIESVGGDINAYTSKEETCIYISIQNQYLDRAVDVLSDIFFSSEFSETELEKEKEVVIDEINSYKDSPNELIFDEFEELFFESHQLAGNILGTETSVKEMSLQDLNEIYKMQYSASKVIFSYVGGVDLNLVKDILEKFFSKENASIAPTQNRIPFVHTPKFSIVKHRDTHQAHCMLGSLAPSMHNENKTAMVLLNNLIGGTSFNAILNLRLREERGLTYNIESNYTAYSDTGIFTVYFGTDIKKVNECKEVIFDIFQSFISSGLPIEALEMYKQQLIGQVALTFDNYVSIMISNAKSYLCFEKVDSYEEIITKIEKVTVDDIILVSSLFLNEKNISHLLYK